MNIMNQTLVPIEVMGEGIIPPNDSMAIPDFISVFLRSELGKGFAEIQSSSGGRRFIFNNSGLAFSIDKDTIIIRNL